MKKKKNFWIKLQDFKKTKSGQWGTRTFSVTLKMYFLQFKSDFFQQLFVYHVEIQLNM